MQNKEAGNDRQSWKITTFPRVMRARSHETLDAEAMHRSREDRVVERSCGRSQGLGFHLQKMQRKWREVSEVTLTSNSKTLLLETDALLSEQAFFIIDGKTGLVVGVRCVLMLRCEPQRASLGADGDLQGDPAASVFPEAETPGHFYGLGSGCVAAGGIQQ
jgi:hypothetical protein